MGAAERRRDWSVITQAALAPGDRWLCADSVAVLLGMFTPDGEPNRRAFLEGPARARSFPVPLTIGAQGRKWRKSEVERWAEDEHRIQSRAA